MGLAASELLAVGGDHNGRQGHTDALQGTIAVSLGTAGRNTPFSVGNFLDCVMNEAPEASNVSTWLPRPAFSRKERERGGNALSLLTPGKITTLLSARSEVSTWMASTSMSMSSSSSSSSSLKGSSSTTAAPSLTSLAGLPACALAGVIELI